MSKSHNDVTKMIDVFSQVMGWVRTKQTCSVLMVQERVPRVVSLVYNLIYLADYTYIIYILCIYIIIYNDTIYIYMLDTLINCWSLIDLVMTYLQQVNSERQEKLRKALEEAALAKKIRGVDHEKRWMLRWNTWIYHEFTVSLAWNIWKLTFRKSGVS